ncbi:MAG: phosphatidylserine decarboxylase [Treponema sp.]|nr:phosphatidylserine decarboxylase [Treponema sp.]
MSAVDFLYGTHIGRALQSAFLALRIPALLGIYLRSPLSAWYIKPFVKKNNIDLSDFAGVKFRTFNDFFTRKKDISFDKTPGTLISTADGLLSAYKIEENSTFRVKGFDYSIRDLLPGYQDTKAFTGGTCLVFRLRPIDYHRYIFVDSGRLEKNHFVKGSLHSVQPSALERYRVYTKNRRSWVILHTDHFGDAAQIEVGAFSVGGIINHLQDASFEKGQEKGFFDLHGSTIVLLLQKDKATLLPEYQDAFTREVPVRIGAAIAK